MIVQESDILLTALDRRLQVDPVLAIDPLAPLSRASGAPPPPASRVAPDAAPSPATAAAPSAIEAGP